MRRAWMPLWMLVLWVTFVMPFWVCFKVFQVLFWVIVTGAKSAVSIGYAAQGFAVRYRREAPVRDPLAGHFRASGRWQEREAHEGSEGPAAEEGAVPRDDST